MPNPNNEPNYRYEPTGKYIGLQAAKYRRLSDEKQEDGWSLEFQGEKLDDAIALEGCLFDQKHDYKDTHTGMEVFGRGDLDKLRAAAKRREFHVLFMYKLDRFSRVGWQQEMIREELKRCGVTIVTLKKEEHADDDTPLGALIRGFYSFKAEEERNDIIQRTQDGIRKKAMSGLLPGVGKPLYGYKWNAQGKARTHYVIDEEKAEVVRRIFAMAEAGTTIRSIAITLTEENIPTPRGWSNQWSMSSIVDILDNTFYTGKASYYKMQSINDAGKKRVLPRSETGQIILPEGVVPALVSLEAFEKVQKIRVRNKELAARKNENLHDALLRCGLVRCGYCGDKMIVEKNHGHPLYRCHRKITRRGECPTGCVRTTKVDTEAWKIAQAIIRDPSQVIEKANKRRQADPTKENRKSLKIQQAKIEHEIKNCTKTLRESKTEKVRSIMLQELEQLTRSQGQIEQALLIIVDQHDIWLEGQKKIDTFVEECAKMRNQLDDPGFQPTYKFKREACEFFGLIARVWRPNYKTHFTIECDPPDLDPTNTTNDNLSLSSVVHTIAIDGRIA